MCVFLSISNKTSAFQRSSYHLSQCQLIPKAWPSGLKRSGFEFTQAQLLLMLLKQIVPVSFCFSLKSNPFARPASLCALYSHTELHVAALVTGALTSNLRCILLSSSPPPPRCMQASLLHRSRCLLYLLQFIIH